MGREICPQLFLRVDVETATEGAAGRGFQKLQNSAVLSELKRQGSGPGYKRLLPGCHRSFVASRCRRIFSPTSHSFSVGKQTLSQWPAAPAPTHLPSSLFRSELVEPGRGVRESVHTQISLKLVLFSSPSPSLQELGFTNFIRTLREGDHERLGKKKDEL